MKIASVVAVLRNNWYLDNSFLYLVLKGNQRVAIRPNISIRYKFDVVRSKWNEVPWLLWVWSLTLTALTFCNLKNAVNIRFQLSVWYTLLIPDYNFYHFPNSICEMGHVVLGLVDYCISTCLSFSGSPFHFSADHKIQ